MSQHCHDRRGNVTLLRLMAVAVVATTAITTVSSLLQSTEAFQSGLNYHHHHQRSSSSILPRRQAALFPENKRGGGGRGSSSSSPLYIFGRNKGQDDKEDGEDNNNSNKNTDSPEDEQKSFSIPFFGRSTVEKEPQQQQQQQKRESTPTLSVATMEKPKAPPQEQEEDSNDPTALRAKAELARLEAERMDAELTLSKIDKLERQLIKAKRKGDSIDELQRQLDTLQAKLRGDPLPTTTTTPTAPPASSASSTKSSAVDKEQSQSSSAATATTTTTTVTENGSITTSAMDQDVLEAARKQSVADITQMSTEEDLNLVPAFMLKILAAWVGMETPKDIQDLNRTEFLRRWDMIKELDYSFVSNYTMPTFTQAEIDTAKQQIKDKSPELEISDVMIEKADGNATQLAIYALEYDYFVGGNGSRIMEMSLQDIAPEFFQDFLNTSSAEGQFATLYPKCTFKEDGEPTSSQVDALARTVLPPAKFSSSSKPEKVPGGYIISGSHKYENGDELIDAIDRELAKTSLADKMTVLYAAGLSRPVDTTNILSEKLGSLENLQLDIDDIDLEPDPVLYITGPDIVRERNRLGLTITSILGIATSWYLSIYPFLLNDGIGQRVDQELQLLEANLQPDLTWLTDLSFPLFATFIALQLVHEVGHRLVAASYGVKLTVPTFVPSLITGITSSVTTFKTLPKNKEAMFDISAAGPLAGITASAVALAIGCKLTLVSDPSTLPALPLDILRQSTLGGGIIDNIIQGSLYVPEGAPTTGIMISLHPIAIAGYISLVVNALSLLPIGTTDGGRLTMSLFDREDKNLFGSLTLLALLYFGLFGSDLFLFYFSFVIAFQTGNEVPARNEVDDVGFSRVIVAIIAYGLAFLSLSPFQ